MKTGAMSRRFARKRKGCNANIARIAEQQSSEGIDEPIPGPSQDEQTLRVSGSQTPENLTISRVKC